MVMLMRVARPAADLLDCRIVQGWGLIACACAGGLLRLSRSRRHVVDCVRGLLWPRRRGGWREAIPSTVAGAGTDRGQWMAEPVIVPGEGMAGRRREAVTDVVTAAVAQV